MFISDTAIKRPVFSIALSIIIIIFGILSYMNLSLQQYPDVEEQIIVVETNYGGAAASFIESRVTGVLEDSLAGIPGLDYMESSSKAGNSSIILFFRSGTSLSDAASDVRELIAQVRDNLPEICNDPRVIKSSANKVPFMFLTLTSSKHNELELNDYAERSLTGPFESLPGVGGVAIYGNTLTMQIRLDREKIKAYNLSVSDIIDTLEESSQESPAGSIIKGKRHVNIVTEVGLNTPEDMGELVVQKIQDHMIHLKDIATITLAQDTTENQWIPRFNKKQVVFIGIKKSAGGNILAISQAVQNYIEKIKSSLPHGMHIEVGYNFAMFIEASIKAVQITIFETIILVLLIILFFLHSPKVAIIPLLTIPVSLIGSFAFLYAFHCSINTITLLAMVLAIGLVVDDAIVVLENIHRHIEEGLEPLEAAFKGSREVGFAVIAMTLTLASVYAPIAFVQGLTGKLFAEFAVSLAGAVLISGVVALTLSPMMCSKLLRPKSLESKNRVSHWIEEFLGKIDRGYQGALQKALTFPKALLGILILVFMGAALLFYKIPSEFAPQEEQSIILAGVQGPEGATLEAMISYAYQLEDLLISIPEHIGMWSVTQRSGAVGGITLKPWGQRQRSESAIIDDLYEKAKKIPGAQFFVFPMGGLLTGGHSGLCMAIKTTESYANLEKNMEKLVKKLKNSPCFEFISHDLYLGTPQLNIQINRNKASLLGVKVQDVARTLEIMLSGSRVTTFEKDGKHYDVVVQSQEGHKREFSDIGNFYVKGGDNKKDQNDKSSPQEVIPLRSLITVEEVAVPAELKHLNKMRSATLDATLKPGCRTDEALSLVNAAIQKDLPPSYQSEPIGNLRKFMESQGEMYLMFTAALLFIYLVLAIQFESLLDPLLIMVTVPLSIAGALLALYLTGGTFNIFSQVGLITLVGLITKHGILIVEFANKQSAQGLSVFDAALKASALRLRPILMTTGAMVLGAIPLALATGAGAESRQQIGWVLVGGLLGGTFFTLFAVPFVYVSMKGWKRSKEK